MELSKKLNDEWRKQSVYGEAKQANPSIYSAFLASNCYKMRNKMDPYYIEGAIAGVYKGEVYLAMTDLYGNNFKIDNLATGFARILCPNLIDNRHSVNMGREEAKALLLDCFKALYGRNGLSSREIMFCTVDGTGITEERETISINYGYKTMIEKEDII